MIDRNNDEFEPATENIALKFLIAELIQREGPITFREFMELALYHPQYGYYSSERPKMTREGDYLTSPEVHPIFGYLMAKQLWQMWQLMDKHQQFTVVEMGAGRGLLCRDILYWAKSRAPEFYEALSYCLIERSERLRDEALHQLERAAIGTDRFEWRDDLPGQIVGCVLSNELVDSFPVHRVMVVDGELREIYVDWQDGRFVERPDTPSTEELGLYFERLGLVPSEGCRAEVNLEAPKWISEVGSSLTSGFVLTFDYGYPAAELYAPWRRDGTLLCFYRHAANRDPFARLGYQDMTAHVDFTTLINEAEGQGLETCGTISQAEFLSALGISAGLTPGPEGQQADLEKYYARRRAVLTLTDAVGLGRIKVLVQQKGIINWPDLWCLSEAPLGSAKS